LALLIGAEEDNKGRKSIWVREARELGSRPVVVVVVVVVFGSSRKENTGRGSGRRNSV